MPRHNYLFLLLLAFLEPTTSSIFWDPEYTYVTTSFCNATDTAQHWTYNSSTSQIWSKQQFVNTKKKRCLSLAPNALNLDISSISVCKSAYIGEIKTSQSTLHAYDSEFLSSMCREHLQNFDHWNNEQYHNFANLVTRNCDDVFYRNVDAPWMSYHTAFSLPRWTYDAYTGSIINQDSGKCIQIGGSIEEQCAGFLRKKTTVKEATLQLRAATNNNQTAIHQPPVLPLLSEAKNKLTYISASAHPALLLPCGAVGCRLEETQQWTMKKINTTATNGADTVLLQLRGNPTLCLRSGVDWNHVSTWDQHWEPYFFLSVSFLLMCLCFYWEHINIGKNPDCCYTNSKYHRNTRLRIFHPVLGVLILRIICICGGFCQVFVASAITFSLEEGGRMFFPRQMAVHGTLFEINLLFIHVMLVSRKKNIYEKQCIQEFSKSNCDVQHFFHFMCIERPTVGLHALYIFVGRGICFITGIQKSEASSEFNALDFMNNNTLLWILIMFPFTFMLFHIGQSIAEVRADPNGGRYRHIVSRNNSHEYMDLPISTGSSAHTSSSSSTASSSKFFQSSSRPDGGDDYITEFLKRWFVWIGLQSIIFVSGFYAPNGSPQWFPTLSLNVLFIGLVVELLFGTIKPRSFRAWSAKYHVIIVFIFMLPIIFLCIAETVGLVIGSYSDYGQSYLQNVGTVGGTGNQMRGAYGSAGWWWGGNDEYVISLSLVCWITICIGLNILPSAIRFVGLRGRKAPIWLEDLLIDTDGHIPHPKASMDYHFFFSKHELYKDTAVEIAELLSHLGFKIWISQFEEDKGADIDQAGMQSGVERSECMLLLMTHGIFHRDRHWVTETELTFGVVEHNKPLLVVMPLASCFKTGGDTVVDTFDNDNENEKKQEEVQHMHGTTNTTAIIGTTTNTYTKIKQEEGNDTNDNKTHSEFELDNKCHNLLSCVHSKECCHGVAKSFQPLARVIPKICNITKWKGSKSTGKSGVDLLGVEHIRRSIRSMVQRYINARGDGQNKLLLFEHKKQMQIGVCPLSLAAEASGLGGIDANGTSKRDEGHKDTRKVVVSPFSIETKEDM